MNRHYFNRTAAQALIGHRVYAKQPFSGIPSGAMGMVQWIDEAALGYYSIIVQWLLPDQSQLKIWVTKTQFQMFLIED